MITRISSFLSILLLTTATLFADESPAKYTQDFEKAELGSTPDELFIIDGEFTVAEIEGNKVIQLAETPLVEGSLMFGPSIKGPATAEAKVLASKKRRSYPRFGIGLHGISGYRLRVVPTKDEVELIKDETQIMAAPFTWKSGQSCHLKISLTSDAEGKSIINAWAWNEGEPQPEKATLSLTTDQAPGQGKCSVWGTPYSGTPIAFDDLKAQ